MIYTDFIDNKHLVALAMRNMKRVNCVNVLTNHIINSCCVMDQMWCTVCIRMFQAKPKNGGVLSRSPIWYDPARKGILPLSADFEVWAFLNDCPSTPLIGGALVEEGHPLLGEGHNQMSFRRAKMPLLVGSYFIPPLFRFTLYICTWWTLILPNRKCPRCGSHPRVRERCHTRLQCQGGSGRFLSGIVPHKSWPQNMCHTHSWPQHRVLYLGPNYVLIGLFWECIRNNWSLLQ